MEIGGERNVIADRAVKKELISRVIGDRGIGNSRAIWQKVIVRTFDDFIIPGGRCPLFRSMKPGIRCSVGKKGSDVEEGTMARHRDEIHNDTTRFLHGRGTSIGPYKTVSLSPSIHLSIHLVYSFVSMLRLFSKRLLRPRLRFLGGEHVKGREDV